MLAIRSHSGAVATCKLGWRTEGRRFRASLGGGLAELHARVKQGPIELHRENVPRCIAGVWRGRRIVIGARVYKGKKLPWWILSKSLGTRGWRRSGMNGR